MASFTLRDYRPYRLVLTETGHHRFGGPAAHKGVTPQGNDTSLHLLLSIDLCDANCPIQTSGAIRYLPLYYPLKYGTGGPEVQYAVISDTEIQILYMSEYKPDDEGRQYIQVPHLPESRAQIIPLEYEEARILGFMAADSYFKPNPEDMAILSRFDRDRLVPIGGLQILVRNAQDVICRNKDCRFLNRRVYFEVIAAIPPLPVNGSDDFWHEFQRGDVYFCFGFCRYCGTVIAFNRSS
jgi:hypothetical protein